MGVDYYLEPKQTVIFALVHLVQSSTLAVYFLIPTVDGIRDISKQGFMSCDVNRSLVAALILVLPSQLRDFHVRD